MNNVWIKLIAAVLCVALLTACGSDPVGDASADESSEAVASDVQSEDSSDESDGAVSGDDDESSAAPTSSSETISSNTDTGNNVDTDFGTYSGTRDPFYWPFSRQSIWNMPIGSGAKLERAGLSSAQHMSIDDEYIVKVSAGDPFVDLYTPSKWNARWPGNQLKGKMQVPYNFVLADASGKSTPNNCAAFIMPDGRTIKQLEPCCRVVAGAQIVGYPSADQDIYGDGIGGTHYGSGLSAIGGSIRKGELTSADPIRHALKLNVWAHLYCYYNRSTGNGYVWPADRNDSYAASGGNAYGGSKPILTMGSLLTIPKSVTAQSLGITTEPGKKMFYALQNYGCYIVDDSAWDCYAWSAESGVRAEVENKYGLSLNTSSNNANGYYYDCMKLISNLYVVTNNSPSSVGGGGTPCQPLAPDFK